jgi:hypothetical protein
MPILHNKNIRFYDFSIKPTKQIVAFKRTNKNDVMRQAGFLGDSYSSKTTPLNMCKINTTFLKPLWEMFCASAKLI